LSHQRREMKYKWQAGIEIEKGYSAWGFLYLERGKDDKAEKAFGKWRHQTNP